MILDPVGPLPVNEICHQKIYKIILNIFYVRFDK